VGLPTLGKNMNRPLKISVVGIFLTVFVVGLALLGLWISSLRSLPLLPLDFLKGRAVTACIEYDPRKSPLTITCASGAPAYHSWIQYYSFEADFSDICKAADDELLALGFTARTYSTEGYRDRIYTLNEAALAKTVIIFQRQRLVGPQSAQLQQSSIAGTYRREHKDGWITVRISRSRLPLWPPRYLLYRLKRLLQAASRQVAN
jgi:hypothetical protein